MNIRYISNTGAKISFTDADSPFRLLSMDGVAPECTVSVTPYCDSDGGAVTAARSDSRIITLEAAFLGDYAACRSALYTAFAPKTQGALYYEDDTGAAYKINCFTEKIRLPVTARRITAQIRLCCPEPYWSAAFEKRTSVLSTGGLWSFPWEIPAGGFMFAQIGGDRIARIYNRGEAAAGCVFEFYARANVYKPKIQNISTFEWFEADVALMAGDRVIINTQKGQKSVKLIRRGTESNIINNMVWGSRFMALERGLNEIVCGAQSGLESLSLTVRFSERFGGI